MQGGFWKVPMVLLGRVENDEESWKRLESEAQKFTEDFSFGDSDGDGLHFGDGCEAGYAAFGEFLVWLDGEFESVKDVHLVRYFEPGVFI